MNILDIAAARLVTVKNWRTQLETDRPFKPWDVQEAQPTDNLTEALRAAVGEGSQEIPAFEPPLMDLTWCGIQGTHFKASKNPQYLADLGSYIDACEALLAELNA